MWSRHKSLSSEDILACQKNCKLINHLHIMTFNFLVMTQGHCVEFFTQLSVSIFKVALKLGGCARAAKVQAGC